MLKKVLIVDDEREFCGFLENFFINRNYSVDTAYDGLKAKDLLSQGGFDYIFFDCNMPGLSGVELARVIEEKNPEAKKIMVSGYELINEDFTKNLGVDAFLTKPISMEEIKRVIENG